MNKNLIIIVDDEIRENDVENLNLVLKDKIPGNKSLAFFCEPEKAHDFFMNNRENVILVISDYAMPGIDGITLLKFFKSINNTVKTVIMTHLKNELSYLGSLGVFDNVCQKTNSLDETILKILNNLMII